MSYNSFEHRHRFAVWAGARAAQRAFTSVENLRAALEETDVRDFLSLPQSLIVDATYFEDKHKQWCTKIIEALIAKGVENVTFGRAAKLIAVYLKSMIVTGPHGGTKLADVVHPPIDRLLLGNLSKSDKVNSPHKRRWRNIAWTQLGEIEYYLLIEQLRSALGPNDPWWMLEEYWTVTDD